MYVAIQPTVEETAERIDPNWKQIKQINPPNIYNNSKMKYSNIKTKNYKYQQPISYNKSNRIRNIKRF